MKRMFRTMFRILVYLILFLLILVVVARSHHHRWKPMYEDDSVKVERCWGCGEEKWIEK